MLPPFFVRFPNLKVNLPLLEGSFVDEGFRKVTSPIYEIPEDLDITHGVPRGEQERQPPNLMKHILEAQFSKGTIVDPDELHEDMFGKDAWDFQDDEGFHLITLDDLEDLDCKLETEHLLITYSPPAPFASKPVPLPSVEVALAEVRKVGDPKKHTDTVICPKPSWNLLPLCMQLEELWTAAACVRDVAAWQGKEYFVSDDEATELGDEDEAEKKEEENKPDLEINVDQDVHLSADVTHEQLQQILAVDEAKVTSDVAVVRSGKETTRLIEIDMKNSDPEQVAKALAEMHRVYSKHIIDGSEEPSAGQSVAEAAPTSGPDAANEPLHRSISGENNPADALAKEAASAMEDVEDDVPQSVKAAQETKVVQVVVKYQYLTDPFTPFPTETCDSAHATPKEDEEIYEPMYDEEPFILEMDPSKPKPAPGKRTFFNEPAPLGFEYLPETHEEARRVRFKYFGYRDGSKDLVAYTLAEVFGNIFNVDVRAELPVDEVDDTRLTLASSLKVVAMVGATHLVLMCPL